MNVIEKMIEQKDNVTGQFISKPTLLSDCGKIVTIDKKDKYNIEIEPSDIQIVTMGFSVNKPASKFQHPNIAYTRKTIHEFKHYRHSGSKFWTSKAGVDIVFIIPRDKITLIPEKGYSYIKAEINGVKVSFNVSGGSSNGWTDYLNVATETSVNHKLSDIKKIAEVAVRNPKVEKIITEKMVEKVDESHWGTLAARANPNIKEEIGKMIEAKKQPMIHFLVGYNADGENQAPATDVWRRYKKTDIVKNADGSGSYKLAEIGPVKTVIVQSKWGRCRVKVTQIDWHKTGITNGLIKEEIKPILLDIAN